MPADRPLTTTQAAQILRCSRQHIVSMCDDGMLPYALVGTHRRISEADVLNLIRPALPREDERSLWLHVAVAGKLVADPDGVLRYATSRLRAGGNGRTAADTRARWQRVLDAGPLSVLEAITSRTPASSALRSCSPMLGLLTTAERRQLTTSFDSYWRHAQSTAVAS